MQKHRSVTRLQQLCQVDAGLLTMPLPVVREPGGDETVQVTATPAGRQSILSCRPDEVRWALSYRCADTRRRILVFRAIRFGYDGLFRRETAA